MTILTLQIENASILKHLKAVLESMHGVKVLKTSALAIAEEDVQDDCPNETTLAAMNEAKNKQNTAVVSMESLESFIASME